MKHTTVLVLLALFADVSAAEVLVREDFEDDRLVAGKKYPLRVEHHKGTFEATGDFRARLLWQSPTQPRQPIPATQFYLPDDSADTPSYRGGMKRPGAFLAGQTSDTPLILRTVTSAGSQEYWTGPTAPCHNQPMFRALGASEQTTR